MSKMKDFRGTLLQVGDKVAIYWGYNDLQEGVIKDIQGKGARVEVLGTLSKWKRGSCMVKLPD